MYLIIILYFFLCLQVVIIYEYNDSEKWHTIFKKFRTFTYSNCYYPKTYQIPFLKVQTTKTNRDLAKLLCLMIT